MDLLEDSWELPVSKNVSRELFSDNAENEAFDVDSFLLENNFQYVPLETLSKDLNELTREMDQVLLDTSSSSYEDYAKLCEQFSETTETRTELHSVKLDLARFLEQLKQLTSASISDTRETVADSVDYMKTLQRLSNVLQECKASKASLALARKLCAGLESLSEHVTTPELTLCCDLALQISAITSQSRSFLLSVQETESPLITQVRNEYQDVMSQFKTCLHRLCDKCHENPAETKELGEALSKVLLVQST